MKIKTNKVSYTLNHDNIANDFSVRKLRFTDKNEVIRAYSMAFPDYNILCSYKEEYDKCVYLYLWGRKNLVDFSSYLKDLKQKGLHTFTAEDMDVNDFNDENNYILVSLILQLLAGGRDFEEKIPYGNYYGHLLADRKPFTREDAKRLGNDITVNKNTLLFNRIQFTKESTIVISVETWKPFMENVDKKNKKLRSYKPVLEMGKLHEYMVKVPWEKVNKEFALWKEASRIEQKLMEDGLFSNWYVKGTSVRSKKNRMPFVTLKPRKDFTDKTGIYLKFMDDVKKKLGRYVSFTSHEEEMTAIPVKKKKIISSERADMVTFAINEVNKQGLTFVCQTPAQKNFAEILIDTLEKVCKDYVPLNRNQVYISGRISATTWNLQIVEPKNSENYKDENGKYSEELDDYLSDTQICIQHYVFENTESERDRKNKLLVILLELLVKDGLVKNHMAPCFCPQKEITIAEGFPYKNKEGKRLATEFFTLTLSTNGDITYKNHFTDLFISDTDLEDEIMEAWDTWDEEYKGRKTLWHPEGFIKIGDGKLCTIYKSTERPFPDYKKMEADFRYYLSPENIVSKETMLKYLCHYAKDHDKYNTALENLQEKLDDCPDDAVFSIIEWRGFLDEACKNTGGQTKYFAAYLEKATKGSIVLALHVKSDKHNPYEMNYLTQIAYNSTDTMYKYFAGMRALSVIGDRQTLRSSLPIRYVEKDPSFTFEEYASLLDVSWVRAGTMESTVIPYPFKILNEYIRMERRDRRKRELEVEKTEKQ